MTSFWPEFINKDAPRLASGAIVDSFPGKTAEATKAVHEPEALEVRTVRTD